MRRWRIPLRAIVILLLGNECFAAGEYNPIKFGAKPDGKTLCTAAIQKAIDTCAAAGGGTVELTEGKYLSGTIFFRSGVTLQLDEGATLLGSTNLKDYPHKTPEFRSRMDYNERVTQSLIYAERVERIALRGKGEIDGQGATFVPPYPPGKWPSLSNRPFIIRMIECKHVLIEAVTLRDSASWMEDYIACDNLTIRGITVHNHVAPNNDGIDIDGCQGVRISDVEISCQDDGLCFKGTNLRPTKDVVVENCKFSSHTNALKFGTDSQGGFEDIRIRNVDLGPPAPHERFIAGRREGFSGMALEVVDGGTMQNVSIDNVKIRGTWAPIYLVLGDRGRHFSDKPRLPPGILRNVTISNVVAETAQGTGCPIIGIPGHPIENIILRNIRMTFSGGGKQEDTIRRFHEMADTYPESIKYASRLPAFGLFCWHVKGLTLEDVQLTTRTFDARPAIALEDVAGLTIDGKQIDMEQPPAGVVVLPLATQPAGAK